MTRPIRTRSGSQPVGTSTATTRTGVCTAREMAGAIDLVIHPEDPNTLFAATWQRRRAEFNDPRNEPAFTGSNDYFTGSGVWKSTDGGSTWRQINDGLPEARYRGRIGLDVARSNPDVVYAFVDNYEIAREA